MKDKEKCILPICVLLHLTTLRQRAGQEAESQFKRERRPAWLTSWERNGKQTSFLRVFPTISGSCNNPYPVEMAIKIKTFLFKCVLKMARTGEEVHQRRSRKVTVNLTPLGTGQHLRSDRPPLSRRTISPFSHLSARSGGGKGADREGKERGRELKRSEEGERERERK